MDIKQYLNSGMPDELVNALNTELTNTDDSAKSGFVYRPYDPAGSDYDNIYVSWENLMAKLDETRSLGPRRLYFDATGTTETDGIFDSMRAAITIPDGTWDMTDVIWSSTPSSSLLGEGCSVIFSDACHIENLQKIDAECDLVLVNKSSTNIPIIIRPARAFFYLGGFVKIANNSDASSTPSNPNAKPVFGIESGGFALLQGFDKLTTLGLFTSEYGVTRPPMNPVFDINGGFLLTAALMWQENAFACTGGNGFVWALGSEGSNDSGWGNIQSWTFTDPGMATTSIFVWTVRRTRYFLDSLQFYIQPSITAAEYANPGRSPLYQPQDPTPATHYACYHNQFVNCDPTAGQVDILLPTALQSAGDVVAVKDKTGAATALSPISIMPQPGETIDGSAGPVLIETAFGCVKLVSDSYGNWMIESSM